MKIFVALFVLSLGLLSGCTAGFPEKSAVMVETKNPEVELTQKKKDLLITMSMDEERIRNGKLYDWQIEVLRQYDYATEYLSRKYPSLGFTFTDCDPKGLIKPFSTFWFQCNGEERVYDLYLYVDEDGSYSCEDNYRK